jgi:hypothetical protein
VSRLDSFIRRLEAQRACIDHAVVLAASLPGPAIEVGLGNGRTYDHLRDRAKGRAIFAFDRHVAAHPACVPDAAHLLLGDFHATLVQAASALGGKVAICQPGARCGDRALDRRVDGAGRDRRGGPGDARAAVGRPAAAAGYRTRPLFYPARARLTVI